jgi:hypothetical protein
MNLLKGAFKNLKTVPQLLVLVSLSCLLFYVGLGIWMILTHGNTSDIHSIRLLQLIQLCCYIFDSSFFVWVSLQ